eukprot:CAMPEP_0202899950 /NCGR_PEP_ID=MMETSP1392-20130828/9342_1 /ASSEMBLY_ACC=CAM_ASM_000868 /TAXON_ID=225041 /ORGANISM="Chlamydomonas chlamydogama, Strain SAG 11-48b" /LENGTH=355 /DNA_ID=CAMNT_0049586255 /DNA_START=116 /DNA_END=1183 /DNA_ORIENTATION=+
MAPSLGEWETDQKFHAPHAHKLRSQVWDPVLLRLRQFRLQTVPLPVVAIVAFLAFLAGTWLETVEVLPAPGGPTISIASSGPATRKVLMHEKGAAISTGALPALQNPLLPEQFEKYALDATGFSKARPALTAAESGDNQMHVIPFQTISWYPRITYYPGFVDKERAEKVIALAKKFLSPSSLAYRPGESIPESQNVRTSSGCFLSREMDSTGTLRWIEDRIAQVTHLPVENGEAFNVLRYMKTQHYDSHYDSFAETEYGKQPSQRIATFLLFLSDVEEGGETVFKREGRQNGNRTITDWRTCEDGIGIKVKPKQGDAVLFWSTKPDLTLDDHALHGACPIVKGEKWSMAKWIHEK